MKRLLLIFLLALVLVLAGCGRQAAVKPGTYTALNPPEATGETVIRELTFDGDKVTMISGNTRQTVNYKISDNLFTLVTKYGDFVYSYSANQDGSITIDGVDYVVLP